MRVSPKTVIVAAVLLFAGLLISFAFDRFGCTVTRQRFDSRAGVAHIDGLGIGESSSHVAIHAVFVPKRGLVAAPQDIFQTSSLNSGLRLEEAGPTLALIVGSRDVPGYVPIVITNGLTAGAHKIELTIGRDRDVTIWLDGYEAVDEHVESLAFAVTDVRFGTGFSATRPYHGRVVGNMTYTVYHRTSAYFLVRFLRIAILAGLLIVLLFAARLIWRLRDELFPPITDSPERVYP